MESKPRSETESKPEPAATPEKPADVKSDVADAKITAETAALVAKFKEMFPGMINERVEGGWEYVARRFEFTSKSYTDLSSFMQAVQVATIMEAGEGNLMGMVTLDHMYSMILAEFARRSTPVPKSALFSVVVKPAPAADPANPAT